MPAVVTKDSLTFVVKGKPYSIKASDPNFEIAKKALTDGDIDMLIELACEGKAIQNWSNDNFQFSDNLIQYKGERVPSELNDRIIKMRANKEDPTPLLNFYEKLQENPSHRSVQQLFQFLQHTNIPICEDGDFLAYKSVRQDYKDHHSGRYSNKPGERNFMRRNEISDDPRVACDQGFHVGSYGFAQSFVSGGRLLVAKINPRDVVSVPYDASEQKMRVCDYTILCHAGEPLPSTTYNTKTGQICKAEPKAPTKAEPAKPKIEMPPPPVAKKEEPKAESKPKLTAKVTDSYELMNLEELRQFAQKSGLKGARHIKGGKAALLDAVKKHLGVGMKPTIIHFDDDEDIPGAPAPKWEDLDKKTAAQLEDIDIGTLRKYASSHLKVPNAYKLPGGKLALINAIAKIRK